MVDPDGGGALTADTLHPANPGAHPTLTATGADVIDLDDGNEVRGLNVDPQGAGGGIAGGAGDTGGGTIDDVNVVDTLGVNGTQAGLELNGTTGTFTISNFTVTNNATGVLLNNAGTVNFTPTGTITISSAGARGLDATGTNMGTSTFDQITATGSANGGVSMTNTTNPAGGSTTFDGLSLTTTGGTGFLLSNAGSVSVPAAGTANVSATGGPAVDVTGTSGAALALDALSSTNSANDGINLAGLGTGSFSAASGTIAGAAGIAFDLDGGSGTVSYPGALNDGTGQSAEITGRSGGAVTLSGPIADGVDAGGGISLSGNSGGNTTFSNASKVLNATTSAAVSFTDSDGHTLTLSGGGLDVDTTTGAGISATNSGTLVVAGTGNTIDSTSATALNVTNTDFGAGGATFQRISSGNITAAADPANGIVLNNTGTAGGLSVTGNGSADSGGTITGASGDGVALTSTDALSLSSMNITSNLGDGIGGSGVNGFVLASDSITLNGNDAASDESGVNLAELTGTAAGGARPTSITNTTISNNNEFELQITNTTGTLTNLAMSGNTISSNGLPINGNASSPHGNLFNFLGLGTANMTLNMTSGTFTGSWNPASPPATITATGTQCDHSGSGGTLTCNISGVNYTANNVGPQASVAGGAQVAFNFSNNEIRTNRSHAINFFADANPPFTKSLTGRVQNNTIGTAGVTGSASSIGFPIRVQNEGRVPVTMLISGNTIRESESFTAINVNHGITLQAGTAATNVTITGNTISDVDSGRAILVQQLDHLPAGGNAGTVCADISGNSISNVAGQAGDGTWIRVRRSDNSTTATFNVRQAAATAAAIATEIDDANGFNDPARVSVGGTPTFGTGVPCPTPP